MQIIQRSIINIIVLSTLTIVGIMLCQLIIVPKARAADIPRNPCGIGQFPKVTAEEADRVEVDCGGGKKYWVGKIPDCPNSKTSPAPGAKCPDGSNPVYPISASKNGADGQDPYGRTEQQATGNNEAPKARTCEEYFTETKTGLEELCGPGDNKITQIISGASNWLVTIAGTIFVLMIVISGIQLAGSAGNPDAIKGAKKRITNVLISLVLLLCIRLIMSLLGIPIA